jgi:hypothetical protein
MTRARNPSRDTARAAQGGLRRHVGGAAVAGGVLLAMACSGGNPPPLGSTTMPPPPPSGGPCSPDGSTQDCHEVLSQHGNITMCFDGVQVCTGGMWGACGAPGGTRPSTQPPAPPPPPPVIDPGDAITIFALAQSGEARTWLSQVRGGTSSAPPPRGRLLPDFSPSRPPPSPFAPAPVVRFERTGAGYVRGVLDPAVTATRRATVDLPATADEFARVADDTSKLSVRFRLAAAHVPIAVSSGLATYPKAVSGGTLIHRLRADGTEDLVRFEAPPEREALDYEVDVSRVAGVRVVSRTVEFLDAAGTPRLRVAPPSVIDRDGREHDAQLSLEGCAFDASPAAPWGRPVTAPAASTCTLHVTWGGISYPAVVDPAWTTTGSMATAREFHASAIIQYFRVLVSGGRNASASTTYASAEIYDPATGTFAATGSMTAARALHYMAPFGSGQGLILTGGGIAGGTVLSSAEVYDGSAGTFTATGSMGAARYSARATVLSDTAQVLVTGGYDGTITPLASAEIFNLGTFTATGSMATARASHAALEVSPGVVVVTGGNTSAGLTNKAEIFTESSGTFAALPNMNAARGRHTMTALSSGKVLVAGSWDQNASTSLASAEIYDPAAQTFTATGSMATARGYHIARLLTNGTVVVAGGVNGSTDLASSETYNATTGTFSALGAMNSARAFHTGTSLTTGTVLVTGGDNGTSAVSSAELLAGLPGTPCTYGTDCTTDVCNDGICCAGACSGTCTSCAAGTGACTMVDNAPDPDTCPSPGICNSGACTGLAGDGGVAADGGPTVDASACTNPCSPSCLSFPTNDAGLYADAAGGSFGGSANNLGGTPSGFQDKELCDPCDSGFPKACGAFTHYNSYDACESDYHCDTTTHKCVQNLPGWTWPSSVCSGVDLTLEGSCTTTGAVFPVCNRGNTSLAAGTTLSIYIVNGNQWSVDPNTCPMLTTSCTFTLPSALVPGSCQDVDTCSWNGNAVAYVNSDAAVAECPQPTGPGCGDNWADIKSGGACQTVTSFGPSVVTQQYIASCPAGTHVQWGILTYSTVVASNSSGNSDVTFKAQTADYGLDGGLGAFGTYHPLADAVVTDPAVCQAPCSIDLYSKLGGPPDATNAVLNLQITISPTPDGLATGSVSSYDLTYSCPPTE